VKWAACQSITLWGTYIAFYIVVTIVNVMLGVIHLWALWPLISLISLIVGVAYLAVWLWTSITAFQGKEVRVPVIAGFTQQFFGSQLQ
jgi:uncharacterized membrane protein